MEGDITLGLKYVGAGLATLGMIGAAIGVGNIFGSLLLKLGLGDATELDQLQAEGEAPVLVAPNEVMDLERRSQSMGRRPG